MSGPGDQDVRSPAVAGLFYPADPAACVRAVAELMKLGRAAVGKGTGIREGAGKGAIVPHAGWMCSGAIAAEAMASLAERRPDVEVVVVFGAIHTPLPIDRGVLDTHGSWAIPGGASEVTAALRGELAGRSAFVVDDRFHRREHAVEVELPLIQAVWPGAKLLPIEVPLIGQAMEIGRSVARAVSAAGVSAVYLASSDLTHYGPNYRFVPAGVGMAGLRWAMENDRRLLRTVTNMTPEKVVEEVQSRHNACGGGAIAAMMSACMEEGARSAVVLRHANSYETLAAVAPQPADNAVGYAAVWVG